MASECSLLLSSRFSTPSFSFCSLLSLSSSPLFCKILHHHFPARTRHPFFASPVQRIRQKDYINGHSARERVVTRFLLQSPEKRTPNLPQGFDHAQFLSLLSQDLDLRQVSKRPPRFRVYVAAHAYPLTIPN